MLLPGHCPVARAPGSKVQTHVPAESTALPHQEVGDLASFRSCASAYRIKPLTNTGSRLSQAPRMVSRRAVVTLLVVYGMAMLAEQTEGFLPIFTHSDIQRMQERERNKGQKKSLTLQQRSEEGDFTGPSNMEGVSEGEMIKLTAPVEIRMQLNSRQLEKYQGVLEKLLTEMLLDTENAN
ncbi:PREDICTED: promotilin isoform X2 [Gavialis gangeticus]|uniref:promotilin isoform X2 n=2 Tax=Gavialis gangeticus TaxID=94835 RepID=UPI00092FB6AC|nr:PREDICTED: promotilin isoform X2 [Gavialis gangeticus]